MCLTSPSLVSLPSHYQSHSTARLSRSSHSVWKFVFPRMNPLVRPPDRSTAPKTRRARGCGCSLPPIFSLGVSVPSSEREGLGRRRIGPVTNQGGRQRSKRFRKSLSFQHHKLLLTDEYDDATPHNSPSPPHHPPSAHPIPALPSPATSAYFTDVMVTYVALRGCNPRREPPA